MRAELYRKHLYYKLFRALQDEGYEESQMSFEEDICYVLPIGFFSFRFENGHPFLVHFLIFKEHRSLNNAIALYRVFRNIIVSLGLVSFIALASREKFFETFFKWVARDKSLEPYMTHNNIKCYYITWRR